MAQQSFPGHVWEVRLATDADAAVAPAAPAEAAAEEAAALPAETTTRPSAAASAPRVALRYRASRHEVQLIQAGEDLEQARRLQLAA